MSNFGRALRVALKRRFNVIGCIVTSLVVATLWAGNLAVVLPIVDAVMENMSIPEWIDKQIADSEAEVAKFRSERLDLAKAAAHTSPKNWPALRVQISDRREKAFVYSSKAVAIAKFKPYADRWLPRTPFQTLIVVCLFVLLSTITKNIFRVASVLLEARLAARTTLELRNQFYEKVLRLDLAEFNQQGRGDLMTRCTTDLSAVGDGVKTLFGQSVREPLKMITCFILAALVSWRLLLLTIIVVPLAVLAIRYLSKSLKRANRRAMEELAGIYETLSETLSGIRLIKAYTTEPSERANFASSSKSLYQRQMRIAFYDSLVSPVTENLGVGMIVLAALAGGYLVLNGQTHLLNIKISDTPLTHGKMSVFFAALAGMSDPARRLSGLLNQLQRASACADRVYAVMDREPSIVDPPNPIALPNPVRTIEFDNVHFRYQPDKPVLEGVSLNVLGGETIAIVGSNGCGKSTLLNLLPRFHDVTAGAIRVDGVDVRDARVRDLRSRIGIVSQQAHLFNDTIAANIAYGKPEATQEQIEQAANQAYAHSFIMEKLSDGYETVVGPGGNRLSGGQRQRIALARAILRNPEILILDEATSQIDVESEQLIHKVLMQFTRGRTTLIITHRPSTLSLSDRVVVMDAGIIEDIGTPAELLGRCDLFRRLCHVTYRESA